MCRYTVALLLLQALWAFQTSASRTFVLSRDNNATASLSGATVISVQLSAASFGLLGASQDLSPVTFDSYVAGAEWTLKNWSQPVTEVLGGSVSDQSVLVDVQFPDKVGVGITKLLLQADTIPLDSVDLSLVFGNDALAGLTEISQVHVNATVVLVAVASFFSRFKKKASKFVEERLTFSNHEDVLLSDRRDEAESELPLTGNAKILADMDLGKDQVKVHKKLGVQGLWLGEYKDMKVVALRFVPRELELPRSDLNAIRLSYAPLKHDNIVYFWGSSWNDRDEVVLVAEHMSKGSLRAVLADQQTDLSWPQRIQMGKDISSGLSFLRSTQGVKLSRNLTAKSVLVNEQITCKLDIFDYASSLRTDLVPVRSFGNGDIATRAPELLKGSEITAAAEVYALGVIFCEISSRSKVFEHVSEERGPTLADIFIATEVAAQRLKPSPAEDTPAEFRQLTLQCLAYEPSDRPNISDILKALSK
ncbi:hypothetical protein BBO99_00008246 [Phytophthora kernoviae]|nr:hypothetical protein G195_011189 [Phytophthora kernoviae 00238/432]RLN75552.1 hypothetical protein BBO99_00008246 [Phytophthora kernoviae]